ncbi:MAG TPA: hypothetical protein VGO57_01780 [Verrucomicrobiae bacterium]
MSLFSFMFGGCSKQSPAPMAMNDKELLVRGWSDTELRQILGDFQRLSGGRLSVNFSTEIHTNDGASLRVTFPTDIPSVDFCFLVNYVQYPKGFDLPSRTILVAGRATINSDFLPSDHSLVGRRILVYIPSDDRQYDEVFAQVDGQSYEFPFTRTGFKLAQAPRLPVGVSDLK